MDEILRRFNGDFHTKEALIEFIHNYIAEEGVRRIYAGEDVNGVRDAKKLIDNAFEELANLYAVTETTKENTNEAR